MASLTVVDRITSCLEQETACINGFRPASALAVNHMAKVKSSKIAQYVCAISRLRKRIVQSQDCLHNLEISTQFRDSENALRNLEIAQIPKLRRTNTNVYVPHSNLCLTAEMSDILMAVIYSIGCLLCLFLAIVILVP